MSAKRQFRTLWRREMKSHLRSYSGWLLIAGFAAAVGGLLLLGIWRADGTVQTLPILFSSAVVAALPPLIALTTMRGFAEERQRGTLEGLLTAPVPDSAVVMAKFAGAYMVVVFAVLSAVGSLAVYAETAVPPPDYSRTGVAVSTVLILLHAASLTALGTLVSILSSRQSQAAAATLALTLVPVLFLSGALADADLPVWFGTLDVRLIARGVIDTRPIVFALTTLFLFLFAAVRALEERRWRL